MQDTIDRQKREIGELKAELDRVKRSIVCSYCGHETIRTGEREKDVAALTDHVMACEKHPLAPLMAFYLAVDELRKEEGASVTIMCANPEGEGHDNEAIEVCSDWTKWEPRRFQGEALADALMAALAAKKGKQCLRPLGCDCPECIERFGPIAPGNVGEDLRSNPTGEVQKTRQG